MCRSIKTLRRRGFEPTREEIRAAALQYVRKVSGMREPRKRDPRPFEIAVDEIAAASERMLATLSRGQ